MNKGKQRNLIEGVRVKVGGCDVECEKSSRAIFFFKQKTAYEIASCLVGLEMCISDSLWGEQDILIKLEVGQRLAADLPGSRLVVFPNCGHIPPIEAPEAFMRELTAFAGR